MFYLYQNFYKLRFITKNMTVLIACLSSGKGTWSHIIRLMESQDWEKIILITNEFGKENFKTQKDAELIVFDMKKPVKELIKDIVGSIRPLS